MSAHSSQSVTPDILASFSRTTNACQVTEYIAAANICFYLFIHGLDSLVHYELVVKEHRLLDLCYRRYDSMSEQRECFLVN
jgi:hypothetical protein